MHVQIAWQIYQHQQRTKVSPTRSSCHQTHGVHTRVHVCLSPSGVCCLPVARALGWAVGSELGRRQHHGSWGAPGHGPLVGGAAMGTCAGATSVSPALPMGL